MMRNLQTIVKSIEYNQGSSGFEEMVQDHAAPKQDVEDGSG